MMQYIFKEQELINEYRYIFLCGAQYKSGNQQDKRNVLRKYLNEKNPLYCPIILEDNFMFRKDSSRILRYDDIHLKDLYQVEMLTNYLSDYNIIIHESISTGAETGLFLSERRAFNKTCLLVPDETAVEEQKVGKFMQYAFMKKPSVLRVITFYPKIEKNMLSNDVMYWHTYFYDNKIGRKLDEQFQDFFETADQTYRIKFTAYKENVKEGYIHYSYKKNSQHLIITALPRTLLNCIAAIFNIKEVSNKVFNAGYKELKEYIEDINSSLKEVFMNTIQEKTGEIFKECSIRPQMNVNNVHIAGITGMSLYFFQAAGFIDIKKADDYMKSNQVKIIGKKVKDQKKNYFYARYSECITCAVETKIKVD